MNNTDFKTSMVVDRSAKEVFNAINNVSAWWDGAIHGSCEKLHDKFSYQMEDFHYSTQQVVELIPNKKIVWLVTESKLNFVTNAVEWTGTEIIFEIEETDQKTAVHFTHQGLTPVVECYNDCSNGWQQLIHQSLFSLITTGKGVKVF